MTTDYDSYSLKKLDEWVHDVLTGDVDAEQICETILTTIRENMEYYEKQLNKSRKVLSLLQASQSQKFDVCDVNDTSEHCKNAWNDFWAENAGDYVPDYPVDYDTLYIGNQYTDEELNAMCDKAASDQERELCREYNERELEYCDKNDKVQRWVLPVEQSYVDGVEDYFVNLPNDLLQLVDWSEGDKLEWIPQDDNSYLLRKVVNEG